ncbi:hypothetical protein SAMN04488564_11764 [Lentzea waywayandensis]|uniref:Uncharacterized protein n=1 Tax=Lentzea waywayandensis TaxID=84724 RepID=A0A1I6FGS1_9PSEU|nr:hypothetical protein [Lentzea waywayandensis]SFR29140.1 hypothetical protein SAMN04488564_11764 [Lentzea waywayandensis]
MIVVVLNLVPTELNEDNFSEHEAAIRAAALGGVFAGSADRIVAEAQRWAHSWEQAPKEGATFTGYPGLVAALADWLNLPPGVATGAGEIFAESLVTFKQSWVDLSHDGTEGGQHSVSLDRRTDALRVSFEAIISNQKTARMTWMLLPKADLTTTKFLANEYQCHHNAARDVRQIFEKTDFGSVLGDPDQRTPFQKYLARRWDGLIFSTKA